MYFHKNLRIFITVTLKKLLGVVLSFKGGRKWDCFEGYSIVSPWNPSVARKMATSNRDSDRWYFDKIKFNFHLKTVVIFNKKSFKIKYS